MNLVKWFSILSLAVICVALAPSQVEARCYGGPSVAVGVGFSTANRPAPGYCAERVVVRRAYPAQCQRVYVPQRCYQEQVVIVEQPYYEEVMVVRQPRPYYPPRASFSFNWGFFSR